MAEIRPDTGRGDAATRRLIGRPGSDLSLVARAAASQTGDMDGLTIRPLVAADRPRWQVLWDGYNAFYGRAGVTALAAEVTDVLWARLFDPAEPVYARVAELDGAIAGIVHYLFHRSTTMIEPICYLQDLFTDHAVRGRGVGGALIEAVYGEARAAGSTRVYWQTHETNAAARSLYEKVAMRSGFIVYRKQL